MENNYLIAVEVTYKLIGLHFGLREDNSSVLGIISLDKSQHSLISLALFDHESIVLDGH